MDRGAFCGLPWWFSDKELARLSGGVGLILLPGRSPGEGNGNPLQYSCLGNPMKRRQAGCSPWSHKRLRHDLATKQMQQQQMYFIHGRHSQDD